MSRKPAACTGVGVEDDGAASLTRHRLDPAGHLGDRLDGADLVVGEHHAHEHGVVGDGVQELIGVHHAVGVDGQVGDLEAGVLQVAERVEDGVVFDGRGDDVLAAAHLCKGGALDGGIVGLAAAAGEDHLAGPAAQDAGHGLPRLVERPARILRQRVEAGSVAEPLGEVGQHGLHDLRAHRRGGSMVHVYHLVSLLLARSLDDDGIIASGQRSPL